MQKCTVALIALLCLCSSLVSAELRRPVVEDFTQEQCSPCQAIKDGMDAIFDGEYPDDITVIATHVWWPGSDKFWDWDLAHHGAGRTIAENRTTVYGVGAVPDFRFDGKPEFLSGGSQIYQDMRDRIEERLAEPSPIRFDVDVHYRTTDSVFISGTINVVDTLVNQNSVVALFVTESWRRGLNPTEKFFNIHRLIVPDVSGVSNVLNTDDVIPFDFKYPIDAAFNAERLASNLIIWKPATKRVLQSWKSLVPDGVSVAEGSPPARTVLVQNRPNPFNPTTSISYRLGQSGVVNLSVFDVSGRLVEELVNKHQRAGAYEMIWDGLDHSGQKVSSGVYYYRLNTEEVSETRKMILIR